MNGVAERLARQVAGLVAGFRELGLYKPPGVAESIDWTRALDRLGATELDEARVRATLGTVLKYREDQEKVLERGVDQLVEAAAGAHG